MPEPVGPQDFAALLRNVPSPSSREAAAAGVPQGEFKNALLDSLEEVNRLQMEAAKGVQRLTTGDADNVAEVLTAVRKADIAFSMMMEMRNKLVEAYRELQQMRV